MTTAAKPPEPKEPVAPKGSPLDEIDDDTLVARLKRLPGFRDLFADPQAPPPEPRAAKAERSERREPANLKEALAAALADVEADKRHREEHEKLAQLASAGPQQAQPPSWREKLWG